MKIMKIPLLTVVALILSKTGFTQTQDSVSKKVVAYVTDKFPVARTFNVEFSQSVPYNFSSVLRGTALPDSRMSNWTQVKASASINFIQTRNWILNTTFTYRNTSLTAALDEPVSGLQSSAKENFQYHNSSLNLTRISKLFNKTTFYTGNVSIDGSDKKFERLRGMFAATMLLKANAQTKMSVGFFVSIDPSSQIPILPTFSYEHHFSNGMFVDITLPRNIMLRKEVFGNGRISLGTELDRTGFYLYNIDNTGKTYEFQQLDINNGLTYEHRLWNYFILTAKSGVRISPNARIFDRSKTVDDYIYQAKPDPSFYFNIGLSFNPFTKKGR